MAAVESPMQPGDLLIRSAGPSGFEIVDAVSHAFIDGPFKVPLTAIAAARLRQPRAIWRLVDERGRPLVEPVRLPDRDKA